MCFGKHWPLFCLCCSACPWYLLFFCSAYINLTHFSRSSLNTIFLIKPSWDQRNIKGYLSSLNSIAVICPTPGKLSLTGDFTAQIFYKCIFFLLDGKLLENLSWPLKHLIQYLAYGRSLTSITLLVKSRVSRWYER